nr:GAF domain-containing protein [Micromonospora sp. DSM 115978]
GAEPAPSDPGLAAAGRAGVSTVEQAWGLEPEQLRWLRLAGGHTLAAVPVLSAGAVVAVVVFTAAGDRPAFTPADVGFLTEVAARAAMVVAPAEAERDGRRGALALQQALLPGDVAAPAGIEVAAHYRPAGGDSEAGGDWYDVIDLG